MKEEKIAIIEKLLEAKHITFREALMLMGTEKEYIYYQWPMTYPVYPSTPISPLWEVPTTICGKDLLFTFTN